MFRITSLILIIIASCSGCSNQNQTSNKLDRPTYKIGYMICNSEKETLHRFIPLSKYLGDKLGCNFETVAIDTINFTKEIDKLDFTHSNSLLYIILNRFNGVDVLAAEKKGSLGFRSQGIILARKDSGISKISELKGKSMIFGPMLAPTGFMAQVDLLLKSGIDPEQDLKTYTIPNGSFKHEKVIYGVMFGKYDAGSIPIDDFENMTSDNRIDPNDFSIIGRNDPIPYCNFGVTQKVDADLARRFKEALISITPSDTVDINGEKIKVLERALVDGYIDIKNADFESVREMAKRTNMPPYQKY